MIAKNPQRTAWLTVLTGFIFFCLICVSSVYGARWFIFDSSANLVVTAHVAQGTMTISSPDNTSRQAIQAQARINNDEVVRTDSLSQGYLQFKNPFGDKETYATVQLMPGSEIELARASRSRFGIGEAPIVIQLDRASGEFNINVSSAIEREIHVEVRGHNQKVRIDEAGYFIVNISQTGTIVVVREGQAVFVADNGSNKLLKSGEHGIYRTFNTEMYLITDTSYDIVPDLFDVDLKSDSDVPLSWGCGKWVPELPEGQRQTPEELQQRSQYRQEFFDDRRTKHFWRVFGEENDGKLSSGSRCLINADPDEDGVGIDVRDYDSLKVRVTMNLAYHSLNRCGQAGSECVLMLRIKYINQAGGESVWLRGFYIDYNPAFGDPTRCHGCFQDHIKVNANTWYTFISDEFMVGVDEGSQPAQILEVEFYSSGHSFDAYVSEFSIVGDFAGQ